MTLAWYVHHGGRGHAARALAFARASPVPITMLSELDLTEVWPASVRLPPDAPPGQPATRLPDPTARGRLHWAPVAPELLGPRTAALVDVLSGPDVLGLVSDVSVETGVLARLCGLPTVAVHEMGLRRDAAHDLGRACAAGLLAPFPVELADPRVDPGHPATFHSGFVPYPAELGGADRAAARRRLGLGAGPVVLVALGGGGHGVRLTHLDQLCRSLPEIRVVVVGRPPAPAARRPADTVRVDGWVSDIGDHLVASDVVVASAGASVVAEVAAARRPLVCVPEIRPFAEQEERARRLAATGAAHVVPSWDEARALIRSVSAALGETGERWDRIDPGPGPTAAVDWVVHRLDRARAGLA